MAAHGVPAPMRRESRQRRQLSLFAVGSITSLLGLVASSVVAARMMGVDAFSAYAAMVSILGVLGAGPAGAIEQETTRRVATAGKAVGVTRPPLTHAASAVAITALVVAVPLGWQDTLFGPRSLSAQILIALGVLGLHVAALARGVLAGTGHRALLGLSLGLTGLLPVVLGVVLALLGTDEFLAFGIGTVIGGGSATFVALTVLGLRFLAGVAEDGPRSGMLGLIAANLFLTINMVAIPAVLRVHVTDFTPSVVASLQIVVSLSRLSTLLVANAVSLVIASVVRDPRGRVIALAVGGATAFGALTIAVTAVLAPHILPFVFGAGFEVSVSQAALASASVLSLNPAYVLTGVAVARGKGHVIAWAWASGALVLALVAAWPEPSGPDAVLVGIGVSAALPTLVMALGFRWARKPQVDSAAQ